MKVLCVLFISFIFVLNAFLSPSFASKNMAPFSKYSSALFMANTFGVQKLGEKVVEIPTITTIPETETAGLFKRGSTGTGNDERFPDQELGADLESSYAALIRVDKSLRQQSLLNSLTSEKSVLGNVDKAERVRMATLDGILPEVINADILSGTMMKSGGLLNDWDFDM